MTSTIVEAQTYAGLSSILRRARKEFILILCFEKRWTEARNTCSVHDRGEEYGYTIRSGRTFR